MTSGVGRCWTKSSPCLDGGLDRACEKIRPPGNDAVFKAARRGPQFASRLNVQGQASDLARHGGGHRAVFACQLESHRCRQRQPGPGGPPIRASGENLGVARALTARS
jgi:MOSC domain-containing protein YiiM